MTLGKVNGAKIDRFFLGGGFLTLGKVNCHRHGWGSVPKSTVFPGRGGSDLKLAKTPSAVGGLFTGKGERRFKGRGRGEGGLKERGLREGLRGGGGRG